MTTWRELIDHEMQRHGDTWPDLVDMTGDGDWLDTPFDNDYGGTEGEPFTLWTKKRVYFPVQYDGAEWVASVPRFPCDQPTYHVGGG